MRSLPGPIDGPHAGGICALLVPMMLMACQGNGVSAQDADRSMKQYELAIGLQGEGNSPGAFQALFKALEVDPNNSKAHLLLGTLYLVARDDNPTEYDAKAEQQFREVLRIQASDKKLPEQSLVAEAHNGLGVLFVHDKRYQDAVDELLKAVADLFNRDAYMGWGNLGWAYLEMKSYPKAIDALLRSVRLHPNFCVGYYRLGTAYLATHDFAKAEQALTQALEADQRCGTFQEAWHLRGEARMNLGMRDDARADFERCAELDAHTDAGTSCSRYLEATY
jgi:type IV pilus assembly protein PilF